MPFEYKLHCAYERNLALIRLSGTIEADKLYDLIADTYALKDRLRDKASETQSTTETSQPFNLKVICDLSQVDGFTGGFRELSTLMGRVWRKFGDDAINGEDILVAPNETIFGVARMLQQIADSRSSSSPHITHNLEEAASHVDVDPAWLGQILDSLDTPPETEQEKNVEESPI